MSIDWLEGVEAVVQTSLKTMDDWVKDIKPLIDLTHPSIPTHIKKVNKFYIPEGNQERCARTFSSSIDESL